MRALLSRIVASALLVAGAAVFLATWGPGAAPASADVFGPLIEAAGFLPSPDSRAQLRTGTATVNGQPFEYAIGHTRQRLEDVLDHYARQFDVAIAGQPVRSTAVRFDGANAGVVSGFLVGPVITAAIDAAKQGKPAPPVRLSDVTRFHMISAYRQDGTVFIEFTPGAAVRLGDLFPAGTADAAGEDVPAVRRPDGLQRLLTIEHGEGKTWSRTLVYRAATAEAAGAGYRAALRAAGWRESPLPVSSAVAHFSNGSRELFVGTAAATDPGVLVVVFRHT